jgi:putative DNA methylase
VINKLKKRFIEWNIPLEKVSFDSNKEKNRRQGHPSTIHIWWARRPLAASRVTNFAALVDIKPEKDDRKSLYSLMGKISDWKSIENGNNNTVIEAKKLILSQWNSSPPKILDPFAGGGSIPLEALRLGCDVYANDLNPVAIFIQKATIEWPHKFNEVRIQVDDTEKILQTHRAALPYLVKKWANHVKKSSYKEIFQFYESNSDKSLIVAYLWVRTIICQNPHCQKETPLVGNFWLSKKKKKKIAYRLIPSGNDFYVKILEEKDINFDPKEGTVSRGNVECIFCNQITRAEEVRRLGRKNKIGERMIIKVHFDANEKAKKYSIATESDVEVFKKAEEYLKEKIQKLDWGNRTNSK